MLSPSLPVRPNTVDRLHASFSHFKFIYSVRCGLEFISKGQQINKPWPAFNFCFEVKTPLRTPANFITWSVRFRPFVYLRETYDMLLGLLLIQNMTYHLSIADDNNNDVGGRHELKRKSQHRYPLRFSRPALSCWSEKGIVRLSVGDESAWLL